MKINGYLLQILQKIEEEGYDGYIVGDAVIKSILGRPIEEYQVVTSAPLFSFSYLNKSSKNPIHIQGRIPITLWTETSLEEYKKKASYTIETIVYHYRHGFIDDGFSLKDVRKLTLRLLKVEHKQDSFVLLKGLFYQASLGFSFSSKLEEELKNQPILSTSRTKEFGNLFRKLLVENRPGMLLEKYPFLYPVTSFQAMLIDLTKNNLLLRSCALFFERELEKVEKELVALGFSSNDISSILHVLSYQNYDMTLENAVDFLKQFKRADLDIWFSLKRDEAVCKKEFKRVLELDEIEAFLMKKLTDKEELTEGDLLLSTQDLIQMGFSEKEIVRIRKYLLKQIQKGIIKNTYDALYSAVFALKSENDV